MKTQLLDMETGLLHEINADNSKRQVQPYTDRGHWDVYREILDTTIISDQQYLGFNCEIIETTSKPLLPLAGGDSEYKSVFTFCDIPQLYNFIKKEKYLSFLHFYHSDTHKKPFYFKLNSQFLADNFCTTIEQVVSIEEKESEPDFFTSLLSIPE